MWVVALFAMSVIGISLVGAAPASAASLTNVTWSASSTQTGATGVTYAYAFTVATTLNPLTSVTMTVPSGTTAGTLSVPSISAMSQASGGYAIAISAGTPTLSGTTLTVPISPSGGVYVPSGSVITLSVAGLKNTTTAGTSRSTVTTFSNATSVDSGQSATASFASGTLTGAAWTLSSVTASAATSTTFAFTTEASSTTVSSVSATLPAGTTGTPTLTSVSGLPSNSSGLTLSGQTLTYSFSSTTLPASTSVVLTVGGLTNTATPGTYASTLSTFNSSGTPVDAGTSNSLNLAASGHSLSSVSWSATSTSTGASSTYTFQGTTTTGGNLSSLTATVPSGTQLSASPTVTLSGMTGGSGGYSAQLTNPHVSLSGTVLTITFSSANSYVNGNTAITAVVGGFTNTPNTGSFLSDLTTYVGTTVVDTGASGTVPFISPSAAIADASVTPSNGAVNVTGVTYTLSFSMPLAAKVSSISFGVPSGTTGSALTIGSGTSTAIAGGTASLSGTTVTYTLPSAAASTTLSSPPQLVLQIGGLTNSGTTQSVASSVALYNASGGVVASGTTASPINITGSNLTALTWSADNTQTGATGVNYLFVFTTGSSSNLDQITIGLPAGTTGTPAITRFTANPSSGVNPQLTLTGTTVSLNPSTDLLTVKFNSSWVPAGVELNIGVSGMTNTSTAGTYTAPITTYLANSQGTEVPIDSGTALSAAFSSVSLTSPSWTASSLVVSDTNVTYTYDFGVSAQVSVDHVTMTLPSGTQGTPKVGTVTPSSLAGGTVSVSGTTLTYTFPSATTINTSSTVSIGITGFTNTATAATYTTQLVAWDGTTSVAAATTPSVSFTTTSLSNPSWVASSTAIGAPATYTYSFVTGGDTLSSFTLTVPTGTTGTPTVGTHSAVDTEPADNVETWNPTVTLQGTTMTLSFASLWYQPNTTFTIEISGLTNTPSAGSYSSTITSYDGQQPMASAATPVISFSAITVGTAIWSTTSAQTGASSASYTYSFSISSGATIDSVSATLPASTPAGTPTLGTVSPSAFAGGTVSRTGNVVTYTFAQPTQLDPNVTFSITFGGITNTGTAGTYSSTITLYDAQAAVVASGSTTSVTFTSTALTNVSWSVSSATAGASNVTYTWKLTTASTHTLNQIVMSVPQGTSGTPAYNASASSVTSGGGGAITLSSPSVSLSDNSVLSTITLSFGSDTYVPSGTTFTIVVTGLTNTTVGGTYSSSVSTDYSGNPFDSGVSPSVILQGVAAPGALTWTVGSNVAGASGLAYGYSLVTSQAESNVTGVQVTVPSGTSASNLQLASLTAGSVNTAGATVQLSGSVLTVSFGQSQSVPSGTTIAFQVTGLTNTSAVGAYQATASVYYQATPGGSSTVLETDTSSAVSIIAQSLTVSTGCAETNTCTVSSSGSTELTIIAIPGALAPSSASVQVNVSTDAPYGYVVSVLASALQRAGGSELLAQAPLSGNSSIVPDEFGVIAALSGAAGSQATLCSPYNGTSAEVGYAGSLTAMWAANAATGTGSDQVTLTNLVRVSQTQPAGTYTGTLNYDVRPRYGSGSGC